MEDKLPEIRFRSRSERMEEKRWKHKLYHRSKSKHRRSESNDRACPATVDKTPRISPLPDLYSVLPDLYSSETKSHRENQRKPGYRKTKRLSNEVLNSRSNAILGELFSVYTDENCRVIEPKSKRKSSLLDRQSCDKEENGRSSVMKEVNRIRDCKIILKRLDLKDLKSRHFLDIIPDFEKSSVNSKFVTKKYDSSKTEELSKDRDIESEVEIDVSEKPMYILDDAYSDISVEDNFKQDNLEIVCEDYVRDSTESYCQFYRSFSDDSSASLGLKESVHSPGNSVDSISSREDGYEHWNADVGNNHESKQQCHVIPILDQYQSYINNSCLKPEVKESAVNFTAEPEENLLNMASACEESKINICRWMREGCTSVESDCDNSTYNTAEADDSAHCVCDNSEDNQKLSVIHPEMLSSALHSSSASTSPSCCKGPISSLSSEISPILQNVESSFTSPLSVNRCHSPSMPCLSSIEYGCDTSPDDLNMPNLVPEVGINVLNSVSETREENILPLVSDLKQDSKEHDCVSNSPTKSMIVNTEESLFLPNSKALPNVSPPLSFSSASSATTLDFKAPRKRRRVRCTRVTSAIPAGFKKSTGKSGQKKLQPNAKRHKLIHSDVETQLSTHIRGYLQVQDIQVNLASLPEVCRNMILCCEEDDGLDLDYCLKLIEHFSMQSAIPENILKLVFKSAFVCKNTKLEHIHSAFKLLSEISYRQPGQMKVKWKYIEESLKTIFVDGNAISKHIVQSSLLLKLLTSALQAELYSCDLLDSTEIRRTQAFNMLAYDVSTSNRKTLVSYIGQAVCSRDIHGHSAVLTTIQDLLSLCVDVSSGCVDCAESLAQDLNAVYRCLPDMASKRALLESFTCDLLQYKLIQVILESQYSGTQHFNGSIPDTLQQVLNYYFKAVPRESCIILPTTPCQTVARESSTRQADIQSDAAEQCPATPRQADIQSDAAEQCPATPRQADIQSNAAEQCSATPRQADIQSNAAEQCSASDVEEIAMLLYFIVKSYLRVSKAQTYLSLRKRAVYASKEIHTWDHEEMGLLGEHVPRLEEHLRQLCPDPSVEAHHYLVLLSVLGDM